MPKPSNKALAVEHARALADLNTMGAVVALLEGGTIGGGKAGAQRSASRIIDICKRECQRQHIRMDRALDKITESGNG